MVAATGVGVTDMVHRACGARSGLQGVGRFGQRAEEMLDARQTSCDMSCARSDGSGGRRQSAEFRVQGEAVVALQNRGIKERLRDEVGARKARETRAKRGRGGS